MVSQIDQDYNLCNCSLITVGRSSLNATSVVENIINTGFREPDHSESGILSAIRPYTEPNVTAHALTRYSCDAVILTTSTSRDSSVGVVTKLQAGRRLLGRAFSKASRPPQGRTQPCGP